MKRELKRRTAEEIETIRQNRGNTFGKNLVLMNKENYLDKLKDFFENENLNQAFFMNDSKISSIAIGSEDLHDVHELTKMIPQNGLMPILISRFRFDDSSKDTLRSTFFSNFKVDKALFGLYSVSTNKFYPLDFDARHGFSNYNWDDVKYPEWYIDIYEGNWRESFKENKIIPYIKEIFPTVDALDSFYKQNELGEEIDMGDVTDEYIEKEVKKYLRNNSVPQIEDWLTPYFKGKDNNINGLDLIYEMEFSKKYLFDYLKRYNKNLFLNIKTYFLVKEKFDKDDIKLTLDEFLEKEIIKAANKIDSKNVRLEIIFKEDNFSYHANDDYKKENLNNYFEGFYPKEYLACGKDCWITYHLIKFTKPIKNYRNVEVGIKKLRVQDIVGVWFRKTMYYSLEKAKEAYAIYCKNKE